MKQYTFNIKDITYGLVADYLRDIQDGTFSINAESDDEANDKATQIMIEAMIDNEMDDLGFDISISSRTIYLTEQY